MHTNARPHDPVITTVTSLEILETLRLEGSMTMAELAEDQELAVSTVFRHLGTLEQYGLVARDGERFKVGLRHLDFGFKARNRLDFFPVGKEKVDLLADETNEKVRLTTEENGLSINLYRRMGDHSFRATEHIGNARPLHQLAAGKAMLAYMPSERVDQIIETVGLPASTDRTITDRAELFEELEIIRDRGFAYNRGESLPDLTALGAAVQDEDGHPICGLSISGAAHRLKGDYLEVELRDHLLGIVNELEIIIRHEL